MSEEFIICGTGHRPNKLGGYAQSSFNRLVKLCIIWLRKYKPTKVIVGMALGWDQALATACIKLNIPFIAAIPFDGFHLKWAHEHRHYFQYLLKHATEIVYVCEGGYEVWKMQKRNEWMVDNSHKTLANWDGSEGGTKNCVDYARKQNKPVINLHKNYLMLKEQENEYRC